VGTLKSGNTFSKIKISLVILPFFLHMHLGYDSLVSFALSWRQCKKIASKKTLNRSYIPKLHLESRFIFFTKLRNFFTYQVNDASGAYHARAAHTQKKAHSPRCYYMVGSPFKLFLA
jgi:hypothetical protein